MDDDNNFAEKQVELEKIERQVERSQLFTHTALGEGFARVGETAAFVHGLIDLLLNIGLVQEEELEVAVAAVRQQMAAQGELSGPGTAIRPVEEPRNAEEFVVVDCESRMHICKAVCCKLNFALSVAEIELGKVKWDLGRPYFIRHESDGYCSHIDRACGHCGVYEHRPSVCRHYSCAKDGRIWKDFDKMELNTEWITSNLAPHVTERLVGTVME